MASRHRNGREVTAWGIYPNTGVLAMSKMVDEATVGQWHFSGVTSGFRDLDRLILGLQSGSLIVLGGRESMGKTALALSIAAHVALSECQPVMVFSMADSAESLKKRLLSSLGDIYLRSIGVSDIDPDDFARLTETDEKLARCLLHIDESKHLSVSDMRDRAIRFSTENGKLGLLVVDYLQLMNDQLPNGTSVGRRMNAVVSQLKSMAMALDCPVLLLSQVKRVVDAHADHRPQAKHLRDCSNLEQEADIIMMIYRDDYYRKTGMQPDIAEINIVKNGSGPIGCVKLAFVKDYVKFESLVAG
jgi:replicative DNA helicase